MSCATCICRQLSMPTCKRIRLLTFQSSGNDSLSARNEAMKQTLLITFAILCFLPSTIVAQELDLLMEKIENTIKANEPEWRLLSKSFEGNSCIVRWAQSSSSNLPDPLKDEYLALIRVHHSEKKAADELQDAFLRTSSGYRGEQVSGIGQEAYLFREDKPESHVWMRFRQHNVSIELRAPSEFSAKRLAKLITDSILLKTGPPVLLDFSGILESKIKSSEVTWKLFSKHFEADGGVLAISRQTTLPEKEEYVAVIRAMLSNGAAAGEMAEQIPTASASVLAKIQEVGQLAYLLQSNRSGYISILFRQSYFVVTLTAPSEAKGRRFAKYIIDSIAALKRKK
jgi:hypothetical protein